MNFLGKCPRKHGLPMSMACTVSSLPPSTCSTDLLPEQRLSDDRHPHVGVDGLCTQMYTRDGMQ